MECMDKELVWIDLTGKSILGKIPIGYFLGVGLGGAFVVSP